MNTNLQMELGSAETATYQQTAYSQPNTLVQIQAKEADVQALTDLTRALEKKVISIHKPSLCRSPLKQHIFTSLFDHTYKTIAAL